MRSWAVQVSCPMPDAHFQFIIIVINDYWLQSHNKFIQRWVKRWQWEKICEANHILITFSTQHTYPRSYSNSNGNVMRNMINKDSQNTRITNEHMIWVYPLLVRWWMILMHNIPTIRRKTNLSTNSREKQKKKKTKQNIYSQNHHGKWALKWA